LGDSSTKTAIDVISYTCKGRGSSLPLDVGGESEIIDGMFINTLKKIYKCFI